MRSSDITVVNYPGDSTVPVSSVDVSVSTSVFPDGSIKYWPGSTVRFSGDTARYVDTARYEDAVTGTGVVLSGGKGAPFWEGCFDFSGYSPDADADMLTALSDPDISGLFGPDVRAVMGAFRARWGRMAERFSGLNLFNFLNAPGEAASGYVWGSEMCFYSVTYERSLYGSQVLNEAVALWRCYQETGGAYTGPPAAGFMHLLDAVMGVRVGLRDRASVPELLSLYMHYISLCPLFEDAEGFAVRLFFKALAGYGVCDGGDGCYGMEKFLRGMLEAGLEDPLCFAGFCTMVTQGVSGNGFLE